MKFLNIFKKSSVIIDYLDEELEKQADSLLIEEMYIDHAIDLISKSIGKAEFNFYKKGKVEKGDTDYLLNVKPNDNQLASEFWTNVVKQLITESEVLIFISNKKMYLAESFETDKLIFKEKTYRNIKIAEDDGSSFSLNKNVKSRDVIHLKLNSPTKTELISKFNKKYADMLVFAQSSYIKANSTKFILNLPQQITQFFDADGNEIKMDKYIEKITGDISSEGDSITKLGSGFSIDVIDSKLKGSVEDFTKLQTDVGNKVAMAFCIPLDVFYGSKTEKSQGNDDFVNYALMPIIRQIENGLNASLLDKEDYTQGELVRINKSSLQFANILNIASSVDKLRSIGYSFNDIQRYTGDPEVEEEWADKRFITKNYMNVEDADDWKGGD